MSRRGRRFNRFGGIDIYVTPFYGAARKPSGALRVGVGKQYNDLLALPKREDILAARDLIVAKPQLVTPMTLMVLAIRFYGVGLRDDAVFWYYAAKERSIMLSEVVGTRTQMLAQANDAVRSFAYFDDTKTRDSFYATRKREEADVNFYWK